MNSEMLAPQAQTGFRALRQFVRSGPAAEYCAMCSAGVAEVHQHLVDLENRSLRCACDACAVLFSAQGDTRYKRVPRRIRRLTDMRLAEEQWESLSIPINMAFLFYNSRAAKPVAMYPSPAGATESSLPLAAWEDIVASSPAIAKMEPDVEALLVNRLPSSAGHEYFVAPIDECYKLVGIIRTHWRGLAGGAQVWLELDRFFERLREAAHA